ncbi:MAG: histidine phosphatase family protein [Proteobacteria bacterium]|nr:histidine phosphatase family protein [Pseudomonadota bacterium]MDA0994027.1 histidine phosphatase family protein [Pseudomonadota bacterium]
MKILTILRHAKSSWDLAGVADFDRALNDRGERDAPEMGQRMKAAGIRPSLIVSSPAARAWSTAKLVAAELAYPVEFLQRESDLYHAGSDKLFTVIARQDEGFNSILIVGHNPGLTDLVNQLVPGLTGNLPTAGFVSVSVDTDTWDLRGRRKTDLIKYDYPKRRR